MAKPASTNPMTQLYRRLNEAGLQDRYVRKVILPYWWDDVIAESPSGYAQAVGFVSSVLGIAPSAVRADGPISLESVPAYFKVRSDVDRQEVSWPAAISLRAAQLSARSCVGSSTRLPSALSTRETLLANHPWIDLEVLLEFCWTAGIAAIHVSNLPSSKTMDGMAACVDGRPVIVVSRRANSPGRLLFILAHELGHVARGHTDADARFDELIESSSVDVAENEATEYAFELLVGSSSPTFPAPAKGATVEFVAKLARSFASDARVYPPTIVLGWAWTGKLSWATASNVLRHIEEDAMAPALFHRHMFGHLDLALLNEDESEFLLRTTGANASDDGL